MKLSARAEFFGPTICGIVTATIFWLLSRNVVIEPLDKLTDLFAAAINVAGIAIGFLATMKAILLGSRDTPTVQVLRTAKRWSPILGQIRWALAWAFSVAVVSVVCLLAKQYIAAHPADYVGQVLIAVWGLSVGGALASAYIVIDILFNIVSAD